MLTFSEALDSLKGGDKIARSGWNGKGMFAFHVDGGHMEHPLWSGCMEARPYIAMKTAQGDIVPWVASQTDILADDWAIIL